MRVFISAGEPSGDLHAGNLARALKRLDSKVEIVGFGGDRLLASGAEVLYPLAHHAIIGFSAVLRELPGMFRLAAQAEAEMRKGVDAVVLIDYPDFHWHLAARAKRLGIPVISFVPPQLWAWRSHRVRKMRRLFDRVLSALPFEEPWFRERGVNSTYVGHPYFDELSQARLDDAFVAGHRRAGEPIVALLPGSRNSEIERNLETLITTARTIHARRPDARFLMACFRESHREQAVARLAGSHLPIECHVGRTAEIIHLADVSAAVSGSVGMELMFHATPSCVIYRINPVYRRLKPYVIHVKYVSLVNLIENREVFPEFVTSHDPGAEVGETLLGWLNDPQELARRKAELAEIRERVAKPGACDRAAKEVVRLAASRRRAAA